MTPGVSIVIATYHREQMLLRTIRDVLSLRYPQLEVIVVDQTEQHSLATSQTLQHWQEAGAIRWLSHEPPGLTRARNVGWRAARGGFVIYIDDDVQIDNPQFIDAYLDTFATHPDVGAVAGRIVEPDKEPETVTRRVGDLGFFGMRKPGFGTAQSGPAYSLRGCNMGFRLEALQLVGGFDEGFTRSAFREDADIAWRLQRARVGLWFAADAWLWHLSSQEGGTRDPSIAVDRDVMRNDLRFALKNLAVPQRIAWILRLWGSRVIKAGIRDHRLGELQRAFGEAYAEVRQEFRVCG